VNESYRILVCGGVCSGKTVFARELSHRLGVAALHLDDVFWYGNWENIGQSKLLDIVREKTTGDEWIVDGNYRLVHEMLWDKCTHIVYMDPPFAVTMYHALKRSMARDRRGVPLRVRKEQGAKEPAFGLLRLVWQYRTTKRRKDLAWLQEINDGPAERIVVRNAVDRREAIEHHFSIHRGGDQQLQLGKRP